MLSGVYCVGSHCRPTTGFAHHCPLSPVNCQAVSDSSPTSTRIRYPQFVCPAFSAESRLSISNQFQHHGCPRRACDTPPTSSGEHDEVTSHSSAEPRIQYGASSTPRPHPCRGRLPGGNGTRHRRPAPATRKHRSAQRKSRHITKNRHIKRKKEETTKLVG